MGYPVDVKATHLTASGAVFAGPARVLAVYYCSEGALGTIVISLRFLNAFKKHIKDVMYN